MENRSGSLGADRPPSQPHRVVPSNTAANAVVTTVTRFHGPLAGSRATAACVAGSVNAGFVNASANSFAVPNRSAASFSNACAVAAATCGGTDLRNSVTGCTTSARIFMTIACADPPVCGGSPANISYNTHPNE